MSTYSSYGIIPTELVVVKLNLKKNWIEDWD